MKYFGLTQQPISSQQVTKEANAKKLFNIVATEGQISRAQLAKVTGLSKSTVSVLSDEMIRKHMLVEAGEGESASTGRKPIMLKVDSSGIQIPCFSFRPTGVIFVLYDLCYEVLEEIFVPYGSNLARKTEDIGKKYVSPPIEAVVDLFDVILTQKSKLIDWDKVEVINISLFGSFDIRNNTYTSTILGWALDQEFINALRLRFNDIPVMLGNNVALMAYAEKMSKKNGPDSLLYLYVGQGVGAGIILNNTLFTGESGVSGEIGRQVLSCVEKNGKYDCVSLEDVISTRAIISLVSKAISGGQETILTQLCDYNTENINVYLMRKAFELGDPYIVNVLKEIAIDIASAISNTLCVLGSMEVYLGGGIEEFGPQFLDLINETIKSIGYQRVVVKLTAQYTQLPQNGDCLGAARAYVNNKLTVI